MPILHSLFCWQGADTRRRFFIISTTAYVLFFLFSVIFSGATAFLILLLLLLNVIVAATTKRRLSDGQLKKWWLFLPSSLFFISGVLITATELNGLQWLLLFPFVVSSLLLTYPSKKRSNYIMGYVGPVDLSATQSDNTVRSSRIEPTLASEASDASGNVAIGQEQYAQSSYSSSDEEAELNIATQNSENKEDLGEQIRHALIQNRNAVIAFSSICFMVLLGVFVSAMVKEPEPEGLELDAQTSVEQELIREHFLEMPDDFTLQLTEHKGLIISWQTQSASKSTLWDLKTVNGDIGCSVIEFNNGDKIRTIDVVVEQDAFHFAQFSPLDTENIISSLAKRGSFKLCDYKFSLKGSQAALGKNPVYAEYLSY